MTVVVWIDQDSWQACVDAARTFAPAADVVLLFVTEEGQAAAARGARAGLLGRSPPAHDPGKLIEQAASAYADELLDAAAERLGRPAGRTRRSGRVEREVCAACADADLLVLARDGDLRRLGPKSLGPATRFVVDHAPCQVLLVWPGEPPSVFSMPPSPPPRQR